MIMKSREKIRIPDSLLLMKVNLPRKSSTKARIMKMTLTGTPWSSISSRKPWLKSSIMVSDRVVSLTPLKKKR